MLKKSFGLLFSLLLIPSFLLAASSSQDYEDAGTALFNRGLYEKSIPYFKSAVQADPNNWQAYEDLGNAYMKTNDSSNALAAYEKSLQIHPNNTPLKMAVDDLKRKGTTASDDQELDDNPSAASSPAVSNEDQPDQTVVVKRYNRRRARMEPVQTYADGLNPIDHAKFWLKAEIGYDYALQTDLINSASSINNGDLNPGVVGAATYSGSALASNSGLGLGGEVGFLLSPHFGLALGARYLQSNDYTADVAYDTGDSENLTLTPGVVPITLDAYFFLPDHDGRFFISAGVGYYEGVVHVDQTTTTNNFYGTPNGSADTENWAGDLYSGNVGFQLGIGRDFAITPRFGLSLFAKGYFAKISNFQGKLYNSFGDAQTYGLAASSSGPTIVDADLPQYINGGAGERYATLDFTGFEAGISLNWYSF